MWLSALRAITYLRFGAGKKMFEPDADWRVPNSEVGHTDPKTAIESRCQGPRRGPVHTRMVPCETVMHRRLPVHRYTNTSRVRDSTAAVSICITLANDCVTEATTGYAYYKGAMPLS